MIEIKQLLYFKSCVEEGSLSQAADKLNTSQPNVSKVIASLEKSIGDKLFFRTGRGVALTDTGRKVLDYTGIILTSLESLESIREEEETVVLGVATTFNRHISYNFLEYLKLNAGQKFRFDFWEGNFHHTIYRVEKNDSNIGFLHLPKKNLSSFKELMKRKGLVFQLLGSGREALFVGPSNPFYDLSSVTIKDLEKCPLIYRSDYFHHLPQEQTDFPAPALVTNSSEMIRNMLKTTDYAYLGYVIDKWTTPLSKIRSLTIEDGEEIIVGCIYKEDRPLHQALQNFISWL